jgi:SAM-dependent methyltransferase
MTVVDFGAGRGQFVEDPIEYRRELRRLQGKVSRYIGFDVDPIVVKNPTLDEAFVIKEGCALPLGEESVDLIVSDWTFEHIGDQRWAAHELDRVLRPGGWICARTPNRWGYIAVGARRIPNRLHVAALRRLQPTRAPEDTFPTRYHLNTIKTIDGLFPPSYYKNCSYLMNNEPAYFGSSAVALRVAHAGFKFIPDRFSAVLYIFLQKKIDSRLPNT